MANSTKYSMAISKECGEKMVSIALFSSDVPIATLKAIGKATFDTMQLNEIHIIDMDTGELIYWECANNCFDFLFEFVEGHECEGEQFLCEEPTLRQAYETLEKYGIHEDEIRFIEKMSVEKGEWLGLDTY